MASHSPLDLAKPLIMGILNITPDSFSDGGKFLWEEQAVAHGMAMATEAQIDASVPDMLTHLTDPELDPKVKQARLLKALEDDPAKAAAVS